MGNGFHFHSMFFPAPQNESKPGGGDAAGGSDKGSVFFMKT